MDSDLLVTPQSQSRQVLDQRLQCASDLGRQLAAMLATFQKELNDWQASVTHLRDVPDRIDVVKMDSGGGGLELPGKNDQLTIGMKELSHALACSDPEQAAQLSQKSDELQAAKVLDKEDSTGTCMQSAETIHQQTQHPQLCDLWTASGEAARRLPTQTCAFSHTKPTPGDDDLSYLDRLVIHPLSNVRYALDAASMAVVFFDIITFPLMAFDFDETQFAKYWRVLSASYWTVDVLLSLFSGYELENAQIETRFWIVSKRRLQTSALFDFFIVLLDWSLYFLDQAKGLAVLARVTKITRLVRLVRLLRAVRSRRLLLIVESLKTSPIFSSMLELLNVMRLISIVMLINHFLGCGWYAVGRIGADGQQSWIHQSLDPHGSMFMHYLVSYHWAIAQFTPCPINIHPTNIYERLYSVLLLPFGLVIFAVLLGSVTAIVNTSRKLSHENLMATHNLQEFLRTYEVPHKLSNRIQGYIQTHRIKKIRILESDVPILTTLASSLRQELHFAIHGRILKIHPIFQIVGKGFHDTLVHFCHTAAQMVTHPFGEEIFHYRSKGHNMFMPLSGTLEYVAGHHDDSCKVFITSGGWICEPPLWMSWENHGLLTVGEQSDLVVINAEKLRKAASRHSTSLPVLKKYAQVFASTMALDAKTHEIDDLWGTKYGRTFQIFEDVDHLQSTLDKTLINKDMLTISRINL